MHCVYKQLHLFPKNKCVLIQPNRTPSWSQRLFYKNLERRQWHPKRRNDHLRHSPLLEQNRHSIIVFKYIANPNIWWVAQTFAFLASYSTDKSCYSVLQKKTMILQNTFEDYLLSCLYQHIERKHHLTTRIAQPHWLHIYDQIFLWDCWVTIYE